MMIRKAQLKIMTLSPFLLYSFVIAIWALTFLSKILYNGLILGFDYGLYHPDGAFYTFRALLFAGYDKFEAGSLVSAWYAENSYKLNNFDGSTLYYENNPSTWSQYYPRVLYPFLSAIFVKFLGIPGMLVIPSVTYLIVLVVIAKIGIYNQKIIPALIAVIWITTSSTLSRWMFANITDGLLMLFSSLLTLILFKKKKLYVSNFQLLLIIILIFLSSATRFSAFFWIGVALLFLFQKEIKSAVVIAVAAVIGSIPIFLRPFAHHVLPDYNDQSFFEKIITYPLAAIRVGFYELAQLFILDRAFFVLLLISLIWATFNWRTIPSQLLLISFITLWLTGSINGVLGVNFRYQLALVPLILWVLVEFLSQFKLIKNQDHYDNFSK